MSKVTPNLQYAVPPAPQWDARPCIAKRCMVKVANDPINRAFTQFIGKARQVVEVVIDGMKKYLDNEDGSGWLHITDRPEVAAREIKPEKIICYLE